MPKFLRIACKCPSLKDRRGRSNYLGSIQVDTTNITHKHCKCCNTTWEFSSNGDGLVTRRRVKDAILYTDEIAVVDLG